jgi:HAD superfamily hydrolase (TIGR01509 family)
MIKAIFFDQDGVIVDTEKDGHRVAFNRTFREFGLSVEWGVDEYQELLQIAGGKERMRHYLHARGFGRPVAPAEEDDLIQKLHLRKTAIFVELIESGALPLRPGIRRVMTEAMAAGLKLAICTTSNEQAARAITSKILAEIRFDLVLAGDIVKKKKPDPEIYLLALDKTGLKPYECVVIEDSRNGVQAAKAAGLRVVVTTNPYTQGEDLSGGDLIVTCLGDADGEKGRLIRGPAGFAFDGALRVEQVARLFEGPG